MLPEIAAAFAPAAMNAIGQAVGGIGNAAMGNAASKVATAGINTGDTYKNAKQWIDSLSPAEQQKLLNEYSQQAAENEMRNNMQSAAFGAGVMNTGANLTTERQMAINAQANAAQNVRDQLNALTQRANESSRQINQAMGMFSNSFR